MMRQIFLQYLFSLFLSFQDLTMGTPAAPQVAPPSWGAPMVNVVCVLKHGVEPHASDR